MADVKVIPITEEYRSNYDRIFGKDTLQLGYSEFIPYKEVTNDYEMLKIALDYAAKENKELKEEVILLQNIYYAAGRLSVNNSKETLDLLVQAILQYEEFAGAPEEQE